MYITAIRILKSKENFISSIISLLTGSLSDYSCDGWATAKCLGEQKMPGRRELPAVPSPPSQTTPLTGAPFGPVGGQFELDGLHRCEKKIMLRRKIG